VNPLVENYGSLELNLQVCRDRMLRTSFNHGLSDFAGVNVEVMSEQKGGITKAVSTVFQSTCPRAGRMTHLY
jgi:hypothetical protein